MHNIFVDFDNTIVESNKRVIEILNKKYGTAKTEKDLKDYNFNSIYPISVREKFDIFESKDFFEGLELKAGFMDFFNNYPHELITIISKGTTPNLELKEKWIKENLGTDFTFIGLSLNDKKHKVSMKNAIHIEDNYRELNKKAKIRILYTDFNNYSWQQIDPCDEVYRVNDWNQIIEMINFYNKKEK